MVLVRLSLLLLAAGAALMCAALVAPVRLKLRWSVGTPPRRLALALTVLWGLAHLRSVRHGCRKRVHLLLGGRRVGRRRRLRGETIAARREPAPEAEAEHRDRIRGKRKDRVKEKRRTRRPKAEKAMAWWHERDLVLRWLRRLPRLLNRLARTVRCEPATLRLRFGLGDPAETGIIYGAFWALLGPALSCIPFRELSVEGDWLGATLASSGRLHVWARPAAPLLAIARFALGGPWLRTLRAVRAAKKANRQHRGKGREAGDIE